LYAPKLSHVENSEKHWQNTVGWPKNPSAIGAANVAACQHHLLPWRFATSAFGDKTARVKTFHP
jgi:hypothetical protein